ncbi:MAG: cyclic nucleotide-binding domain-containing protein [Polyangia bacterium]|jgi:CRP-like cAMP-binding protein|nr:cyclic nucleotide-binding domain-containing protein [Polyangia bacterium]
MGDDLRPNKKQLKKLVKDYTASVKQDPNNLVARLKLAGALKELGNGREAIEHYQAVAKAYTESGKLVQAISVYKGILEIDPKDQGAEAALSELSSKRSEEIQRKGAPRLQQEGGRWVLPTDASPSEEPAASASQDGATPSRLRLPSQPGGASSVGRRTRRSRPFLHVPEDLLEEGEMPPGREADSAEQIGTKSLPGAASTPGSASPGWAPPAVPRVTHESQTSLPRLFKREQEETGSPSARVAPPPPPPPPAVAPAKVPLAEGAPVAGSPQPSKPGQSAQGDFVEETTSPGPKTYDEMIRESVVRLDRARLEPAAGGSREARPRRTLVGVPPHSQSELGRVEPDLSVHHRPTPAVPLPAITLRKLERGESPEEEVVVPPPVSDKVTMGPGEAGAPTAKETSLDWPRPSSTPVSSVATVSSVFDAEEDAFWAEMSKGSSTDPASVQPQTISGIHQAAAQGPSRVDSTPPAEARRPRATLPMAAIPAGSAPATPSPGPPPTAARRELESRAPLPVVEPTVSKIEDISIFRDISESSRDLLRSRVSPRKEVAGTVVVREGDPGHALFVLVSGRVSVTKTVGADESLELATLGPGSFFGEFALLSDRKRHATVTVTEDAVIYEISRKVIADLTKAEPAFGNTLRAFYRRRLLGTLLASAPFFTVLNETERESLMGRLRFRRVPDGTKIISEGEPGGGFFLILIGQVRISKAEPDGSARTLATLGDGSYFGEMSLLKGGNAVASVTTVAPTELVQLAASEFYRILSHYPQIWEEVNREAKRRELANLQILSGRTRGSHGDSVVL